MVEKQTVGARIIARVRHLLLLDNWPILPKILFISFFSVTLTLLATLFVFIPKIESYLIEEKKSSIRAVVDVAHGLIAHYYALSRSAVLDETKARVAASQALKSLRFGETQYFWIIDTVPTMIMHPMVPDLEGKNMNDFTNQNGEYLFREFVGTAKAKGSGFVTYQWPKPDDKTPVPKMSFVKLFEPWGWVVGSGIYLDDIEAEMVQLRLVSIGSALFFAVTTLCLAFWIGLGITHRLGKVINGLKEVASGKGNVDLSKRIAITSIDEIGILSLEFNMLMESIGSLSRFKKIIEEDDTLEDVYSRLWYVFSEELGLKCARIYEVDVVSNRMSIAYPVICNNEDACCHPDIFDNSNLCKAKRTAHEIASLECPRICKQFLAGDRLDHVCLPMTIGNGTLGVVQFVFEKDRTDQHGLAEKVFKAAQYINEALPVIESRRLTNTLRESSLTDPMTGLKNRRFLQECADSVCKGILRRGKSLALLMCDIDYFKQVNDTHGHDVGDDILKQTAVVLRQGVRESDLVLRFGGEEFLIALIDADNDSAFRLAEKLRQAVESQQFALPGGGSLQKTISIGISEFPADSESFWRVLKFADVALYQAKESGRNRVVRFTSDLWKDDQY